jgi:hypothetical protein
VYELLNKIKELTMDFKYFIQEISAMLVRLHPDKIPHEYDRKTLRFMSYKKEYPRHINSYYRVDTVLKYIFNKFFIIQLTKEPYYRG